MRPGTGSFPHGVRFASASPADPRRGFRAVRLRRRHHQADDAVEHQHLVAVDHSCGSRRRSSLTTSCCSPSTRWSIGSWLPPVDYGRARRRRSGPELRADPAMGAASDAAGFPAGNHRAGGADVYRRDRTDSRAVPGQMADAHRGDVRRQRRAVRGPVGRSPPGQVNVRLATTRSADRVNSGQRQARFFGELGRAVDTDRGPAEPRTDCPRRFEPHPTGADTR